MWSKATSLHVYKSGDNAECILYYSAIWNPENINKNLQHPIPTISHTEKYLEILNQIYLYLPFFRCSYYRFQSVHSNGEMVYFTAYCYESYCIWWTILNIKRSIGSESMWIIFKETLKESEWYHICWIKKVNVNLICYRILYLLYYSWLCWGCREHSGLV